MTAVSPKRPMLRDAHMAATRAKLPLTVLITRPMSIFCVCEREMVRFPKAAIRSKGHKI